MVFGGGWGEEWPVKESSPYMTLALTFFVALKGLKVAENSFQYFPRRGFRWAIITTLY